MTEQEFMASQDPQAMWYYLKGSPPSQPARLSPAQERLWVEACMAICTCPAGPHDVHTCSIYPDAPGCPCTLAMRANLLREIRGNPFKPAYQCEMCLGGGYVPTDRDDNTCEVCKGSGSHFPKRFLTPTVLARLHDLHPNWRVVMEPPWEDAVRRRAGEVNIWTDNGCVARVPFESVDSLPRAVAVASILALEGQQ